MLLQRALFFFEAGGLVAAQEDVEALGNYTYDFTSFDWMVRTGALRAVGWMVPEPREP